MAAEKDLVPFGNFTIEDNISGIGNQEVFEGLFNPEIVTETSSNIQKLEETPKPGEKKEVVPKIITKETKQSIEDKKREADEARQKAQEDLDNQVFEEEENEENTLDVKSKTSEDAETPDTQELNKFEALSKDLFKLNVFTKEEGEEDVAIKTPEEFLERFNYEKKKGAIETVNNFIGQFGEDYQNAFEAIFVKGVDPQEYFTTFNNIHNVAEMDLTQESNQEAIVRQFYTDQGLQAEAIKNKIEKLKSYGDLEEESKNLHEVLVKKEAQKLSKMEQESQVKLQQQQSIKEQYVKNVQNVLQEKLKAKEFDGIPLNPKFAQEVQDFLVTEKWKTPAGEPLTDFDVKILDLKKPENHQTKVKIALLLKILEKDPTLSTIQKTAVSKKTDTLFENLVTKESKSTNKSAKPTLSTWFS